MLEQPNSEQLGTRRPTIPCEGQPASVAQPVPGGFEPEVAETRLESTALKTTDKLTSLTLKDLLQMAKKQGVHGWHGMRKEQLVKALSKAKTARGAARATATKTSRPLVAASRRSVAAGNGKTTRVVHAKNTPPTAAARPSATVSRPSATVSRPTAPVARPAALVAQPVKRPAPPAPPTNPHIVKRIKSLQTQKNQAKDLAAFGRRGGGKGFVRDRLVVMVRDSFWLHAYWELTQNSVERAEVALGQDWHLSRPVLRILDVTSHGASSGVESVVKHIDIHGGVNNWYIEVQDPPRSYRVEIGYLAAGGKFFMIARSNVVTTPKAGSSDEIDFNWTPVAENFDKIYALSGGYSSEGAAVELTELFEERLRRPMGSPMMTRFGSGAEAPVLRSRREFDFTLDAELLVFGNTLPDAHVTLQGSPVHVRPDGSFTVRFSLPNCRQVIPAVASSADGVEQRTVVLAVERNTKVMEPLTRDSGE